MRPAVVPSFHRVRARIQVAGSRWPPGRCLAAAASIRPWDIGGGVAGLCGLPTGPLAARWRPATRSYVIPWHSLSSILAQASGLGYG